MVSQGWDPLELNYDEEEIRRWAENGRPLSMPSGPITPRPSLRRRSGTILGGSHGDRGNGERSPAVTFNPIVHVRTDLKLEKFGSEAGSEYIVVDSTSPIAASNIARNDEECMERPINIATEHRPVDKGYTSGFGTESIVKRNYECAPYSNAAGEEAAGYFRHVESYLNKDMSSAKARKRNMSCYEGYSTGGNAFSEMDVMESVDPTDDANIPSQYLTEDYGKVGDTISHNKSSRKGHFDSNPVYISSPELQGKQPYGIMLSSSDVVSSRFSSHETSTEHHKTLRLAPLGMRPRSGELQSQESKIRTPTPPYYSGNSNVGPVPEILYPVREQSPDDGPDNGRQTNERIGRHNFPLRSPNISKKQKLYSRDTLLPSRSGSRAQGSVIPNKATTSATRPMTCKVLDNGVLQSSYVDSPHVVRRRKGYSQLNFKGPEAEPSLLSNYKKSFAAAPQQERQFIPARDYRRRSLSSLPSTPSYRPNIGSQKYGYTLEVDGFKHNQQECRYLTPSPPPSEANNRRSRVISHKASPLAEYQPRKEGMCNRSIAERVNCRVAPDRGGDGVFKVTAETYNQNPGFMRTSLMTHGPQKSEYIQDDERRNNPKIMLTEAAPESVPGCLHLCHSPDKLISQLLTAYEDTRSHTSKLTSSGSQTSQKVHTLKEEGPGQHQIPRKLSGEGNLEGLHNTLGFEAIKRRNNEAEKRMEQKARDGFMDKITSSKKADSVFERAIGKDTDKVGTKKSRGKDIMAYQVTGPFKVENTKNQEKINENHDDEVEFNETEDGKRTEYPKVNLVIFGDEKTKNEDHGVMVEGIKSNEIQSKNHGSTAKSTKYQGSEVMIRKSDQGINEIKAISKAAKKEDALKAAQRNATTEQHDIKREEPEKKVFEKSPKGQPLFRWIVAVIMLITLGLVFFGDAPVGKNNVHMNSEHFIE